jgi:hypothetical protein
MHRHPSPRYLCLPLLFLLILLSAYIAVPARSAYFPITSTATYTPSSTLSPVATSTLLPTPSLSPAPSPSPDPTIIGSATSTPLPPSPIVYATPIIGAFRQHQRQAPAAPAAPAAPDLITSGSVGSATSPSAITLDGNNHTVTYKVAASLTTIVSSTAQWTLSITSTQFSTGGAHPSTLSTTASTITSAPSVTCLAIIGNCLTPTNTISYPLTVPAASTAPSAVNYYSGSTPSGLVLTFTITPTINVFLPASTAPGTYTSTVTVVLSNGP